MTKRYLMTTTKNPTFAGKRCGIQFTDGRAVVDEFTMPRGTSVPLEDLVKQIKSDFPGITVTEVLDIPAITAKAIAEDEGKESIARDATPKAPVKR